MNERGLLMIRTPELLCLLSKNGQPLHQSMLGKRRAGKLFSVLFYSSEWSLFDTGTVLKSKSYMFHN
jgi:hypothetical protein